MDPLTSDQETNNGQFFFSPPPATFSGIHPVKRKNGETEEMRVETKTH